MRIRNEINNLKREEDEMRSVVGNLRLSMESETRACEETRRRLLLLADEEGEMKDAENR